MSFISNYSNFDKGACYTFSDCYSKLTPQQCYQVPHVYQYYPNQPCRKTGSCYAAGKCYTEIPLRTCMNLWGFMWWDPINSCYPMPGYGISNL